MAELLACWKCHQPVYENARCKNCGASYTLPTRPMIVLTWVIFIAAGAWLLFHASVKSLAFAVIAALVCCLFYGLGRNYQFYSRKHH
jgi:hypothetical protein